MDCNEAIECSVEQEVLELLSILGPEVRRRTKTMQEHTRPTTGTTRQLRQHIIIAS